MATATTPLLSYVRQRAVPLTGAKADFDRLMDRVGDARVVLLGEASHGTHEFYRERARITKRLVCEKGFTAVAVEADWPDAYRVNRYVLGANDDADAADALGGFQRFPAWMWRNADVLDFVSWLREHDDARRHGAPRTGFYGLDLYSLYASIAAVLRFLDAIDPEAARIAREHYACFEQYGDDAQAYGYAASLGMARSCEKDAVAELVELQRRAGKWARGDGVTNEDEIFFAEQNARLIKNAEEYYRGMFLGRVSSWNLRDGHMAETLEHLAAHLDARTGGRSKIVVWAHNSHVGDARATAMGEAGEWTLGQLARERFGASQVVIVGFTTYDGTVTAARAWDKPAARWDVRPALAESWEAAFHAAKIPRFLLLSEPGSPLHERRLERAIGVVYAPHTERLSHYFEAELGAQLDAVIHLDRTRAVEPLERAPGWTAGESPETYPFGV